MADLTSDAPLRFIGPVYSEKWDMDRLAAAYTIYKGAPVIVDVSENAEAGATQEGVTMTATDLVLGIAAEGATISPTGDDTPTLEVFTWPTIVGFKSAVFTTADLGKDVYMPDTATLGEATGTFAKIGVLFKVQDGYAFVLLNPPAVRGAVA